MSFPQPSAGAPRPSWTISALVGGLARLFSGRRAHAAGEAPSSRSAGAISPDYARLVNTLPDPILVVTGTDPEDVTGRRYIFANPAARELLRMDHEHGLLVSAIRDPQVLETVDEALFGGIPAECVYEIAGAQAKVLRVQARPLAEASDGERMAVLSFRDETELRRVERTRVDFLANASHELRTPLASLSGFIETLRGHAREDEGARERFLGIMQAQAERMSRLIDDLMSLSRIELNEHVAPDNEVDLALAVMDVVDAATLMAKARGVTLEPHLVPKGAACIVGDRDQIVQVVQNLVDNALKYSPAGSAIHITLEAGLTAAQAAAGRRTDVARLSLLTPDHTAETYAVLRVSDEGAGMARQHLPRLTERFYRIEGQKSGEREGTGLGLAIVKHIANRHRGGLVVESAEGRGATFTAYFPMRAGAGEAAVAKVS
ncbi:MAG: sensor histidine kinase [Phenylobacterium sp.]